MRKETRRHATAQQKRCEGEGREKEKCGRCDGDDDDDDDDEGMKIGKSTLRMNNR